MPDSASSLPPPLLVVDDEVQVVRSLEISFMDALEVLTATSGEQALDVLAKRPEVGVILTDQRMPGMTGVELLARSRETHPEAVRILLTGFTDVEALVDAINEAQVYRYVPKPWEPRDLEMTVHRAMELHRLTLDNRRLTAELTLANARLTRENVDLRRAVVGKHRFDGILGTSEPMTRLFDLLEKIARSDATVLIQGETGTGKERIARAIHFHGRRKDGPFVVQNCAALTETLLESELFGHKRGSFTGAVEDKKGLFELADGGTVFLDEIGETSAALQARLLRVLQEGEVKPVGASAVKRVDVRVVSATNRDLAAEVGAGRFREDLFYRLNLFTLTVPPLRDRIGDIPLLVHHFLARSAQKLGVAAPALTREALEVLVAHSWPGNVRELENEIERAVTLASEGEALTLDLFSDRVRGAAGARAPRALGYANGNAPAATSVDVTTSSAPLEEQVDDLKRALIRRALAVHGSKAAAAVALGITRQSLQKMMRRLELER